MSPFLLSLHLLLTTINPFQIPFTDKKDLTQEDVVEIQGLLRRVDMDQTLEELFPTDLLFFQRIKPLRDIKQRTTRCLKQVLIDVEKGLLPESGLIEINDGGEDCFVVSCPFNGPYRHLFSQLVKGLEEVGFQGNVYYRIGGVANPTGKEAKWAGVPYAFKIFTMMEAHQLGFRHLIWLDSSLFALKNPQKLFEKLRKESAIVLHRSHPYSCILPATKNLIETLTGVDLEQAAHVRMWVFGLDMESEWAHTFFKNYTEMVELGLPFISCYPEEFVISALLDPYKGKIRSLTDPMMASRQGYGGVVTAQSKDPTHYRNGVFQDALFMIREH